MTHTNSEIGHILEAKEIKKVLDADEATKERIYSGISCIDEAMNFFRLGEIHVISAPTGHGKTSFCRFLIANFADLGYNCLYLGQEGVSTAFFEKFPNSLPRFYMSDQFIKSSLFWFENTILKAKKEQDCKIVFIDHLHYILDFSSLQRGQASLFIGEFMRNLVNICAKHKILAFLVCHTTKDVIAKAPNLSDIRDSSFVTQECDGAFMIYRRSIVDKVSGEIEYLPNKCKIAIQKNRRNGILKTFKMKYWQGNFAQDMEE